MTTPILQPSQSVGLGLTRYAVVSAVVLSILALILSIVALLRPATNGASSSGVGTDGAEDDQSHPGDLAGWSEVGLEAEFNEISMAALHEKFSAFQELIDKGVALKERRSSRDAINASPQFVYVARKLDRIDLEVKPGLMMLWCSESYFDPRTGNLIYVSNGWTGESYFWAGSGLRPSDVDARNAAWQDAMMAPTEILYSHHEGRFIDLARAKSLQLGDTIVCSLRLFIDDREQARYISTPVRLMAIAKPRSR